MLFDSFSSLWLFFFFPSPEFQESPLQNIHRMKASPSIKAEGPTSLWFWPSLLKIRISHPHGNELCANLQMRTVRKEVYSFLVTDLKKRCHGSPGTAKLSSTTSTRSWEWQRETICKAEEIWLVSSSLLCNIKPKKIHRKCECKQHSNFMCLYSKRGKMKNISVVIATWISPQYVCGVWQRSS